MLEQLWQLWRWLIRVFVIRGECDDGSEEGSIETAFQIGCLIVTLVAGLIVLIAWLSRL
jgi:hypothetical protein